MRIILIAHKFIETRTLFILTTFFSRYHIKKNNLDIYVNLVHLEFAGVVCLSRSAGEECLNQRVCEIIGRVHRSMP